jgi:hypothetical protein
MAANRSVATAQSLLPCSGGGGHQATPASRDRRSVAIAKPVRATGLASEHLAGVEDTARVPGVVDDRRRARQPGREAVWSFGRLRMRMWTVGCASADSPAVR